MWTFINSFLIVAAQSTLFFSHQAATPKKKEPKRRKRRESGSGTAVIVPRTSPPPNWVVWKLMYEWSDRMFGNCALSVVLLPSSASHLPLIAPPTPVENGVTRTSGGLLSFNGAPKNPHTTCALVVGATVGEAWMCATVRLSLMSGDCKPVKSMLKIVAENVMAVIALFSANVAVPNDAGLGLPVEVVGITGGFS